MDDDTADMLLVTPLALARVLPAVAKLRAGPGPMKHPQLLAHCRFARSYGELSFRTRDPPPERSVRRITNASNGKEGGLI